MYAPEMRTFAPHAVRTGAVCEPEMSDFRCQKSDPDFIINLGDNFYWGGVGVQCGAPTHQVQDPGYQHLHRIVAMSECKSIQLVHGFVLAKLITTALPKFDPLGGFGSELRMAP